MSECDTHRDPKEEEKAMEILLELNLKQKLATRLGILLAGFIVFGLFCCDSALASLTLGALMALMLRNPTNIFAFVMTCHRDFM